VEAQVEGLLATVDEDIPVKFRPCDVLKEMQSLIIGEACGFDGIQNENLRRLTRRPLVHLTRIFNHCLRLGQFPAPRKEIKFITLPKPGKYSLFSPNLRPIRPLVHYGQII
jgi:hypothetical protein